MTPTQWMGAALLAAVALAALGCCLLAGRRSYPEQPDTEPEPVEPSTRPAAGCTCAECNDARELIEIDRWFVKLRDDVEAGA